MVAFSRFSCVAELCTWPEILPVHTCAPAYPPIKNEGISKKINFKVDRFYLYKIALNGIRNVCTRRPPALFYTNNYRKVSCIPCNVNRCGNG